MLGNIKYENLRAEMGRRNLSKLDISKLTGINRDTLSRKLSGKSKLYLNEAFEIQTAAFPEVDIAILFKEDIEAESLRTN